MNEYDCEITSNHTNPPYSNTAKSPQCITQKNIRRIIISNHLSATRIPARLCYIIRNVENPKEPGPSDNFYVSIYDRESK